MMRFGPSILKSPLLVVISASAFSQSSFAAPLNLNYEATASGTQIYNLATTNVSATTSTSLTYGNSFFAPTTTIPTTSFGFYDDYVFSVSDSSANSITATIDLDNLSIDNLNVRLFTVSGNAEQSAGVTLAGVAAGTMAQSWTYMPDPLLGFTGEVAIINKTGLAAGSYVLQVRGNVTGSAGGSYAGTLNVTPVPVPGTLPLLMSGLGLLGSLFIRRRAGN